MKSLLTSCQQIGSHKAHNQDALFNGQNVFQYKLKKAETIEFMQDKLRLGIADGVSSSPHSRYISRFVMEELTVCENFSTQWLRNLQSHLTDKFIDTYAGAASTFVACEINEQYQCRAYPTFCVNTHFI